MKALTSGDEKFFALLTGLGVSEEHQSIINSNFSLEDIEDFGSYIVDTDITIEDIQCEENEPPCILTCFNPCEKATEEGLERYEDDGCQSYITISKIMVPTKRDKEQLLLAFKYIHDLRSLDTDYKAVNTIAHQYECEQNIIVEEDIENRLHTDNDWLYGYKVAHCDHDYVKDSNSSMLKCTKCNNYTMDLNIFKNLQDT